MNILINILILFPHFLTDDAGTMKNSVNLAITQNLPELFNRDEGETIVHKITDKSDPLSEQNIIELRSKNGLPVWFSREIYKSVCLDKQCNLIRLGIFWDGAGNFLKLKIHESAPLSKTDHTNFTEADYNKLIRILSDSLSVLKDLKMEELVARDKRTGKMQTDANSGATQPELKDYLVSNAAYTCYTLWHTVYGPSREIILSLIEQRADDQYLSTIFQQDEPSYILWAIGYIERKPLYKDSFASSIASLILSKKPDISNPAFNYFSPGRLSDPKLQKEIVLVFGYLTVSHKNELIQRLSELDCISNESYFLLLEQYEKKLIDAGFLRKICAQIYPENIRDKQVLQKLKFLSESENPFVSSIVRDLIK